MARINDPYAPPSKVTDERVADLLRDLVERMASLASMPERLMALEEVVRQLVVIAAQEPAADPAAGDIARALASLREVMMDGMRVEVPPPPPPVDLTPVVAAIEASSLDSDKLMEELKRIQPTVVGGSQTRQVKLLSAAGGLVSPATEATLQQIRDSLTGAGGSAVESRLDYDGRLDGNPVYVGAANQGTATASADWTVQKLEYDVSARLTRKQVILDAVWDDRASLGWT